MSRFLKSLYRPRVERLEARELLSAAADHLREAYGQLPLSFEANHGQTDAQVRFLSRGSGYALFLTGTEAVLSLHKPAATAPAIGPAQADTGAVLRMRLVGTNPAPAVAGQDQLPGKVNYFLGSDAAKWRTNIATYGRVAYDEVYPGIDLVYYGTSQRQLEYDFIVAPGVNPGVIALAFEGARRLALDGQGNLVLDTAGGAVVHRAPVLYQEGAGGRQAVAGRYVLAGEGRVGFVVGAYDRTRPLVIDPVLSYSSYLGGSGFDVGYSIAVGGDGSAYLTGQTGSTNFPRVNPFQPSLNGLGRDAFVTKVNASGSALVYSSYLGGSGNDFGYSIAVGGDGSAYLTGITDSTNFPRVNPFQPANGGGIDVFVAKVNASGSALVYSSFLGGSGDDQGGGIAVGGDGSAYLTGSTTSSTNFPRVNAFQPAYGGVADAFVAKVNASGSALVYSSFLGGSSSDVGRDIAVGSDGSAYLTGQTFSTNFPRVNPFQPVHAGDVDAFVAKVNASGSALVYSSFLGGSVTEFGQGIAVGGDGSAYLTGLTTSTNFPRVSPFQPTYGGGTDAFVTKVNASGSALVYSSYLGGSGGDVGNSIAVAGDGSAYLTGQTSSFNFPTASPFQPASGGGIDAFVTKVNASGSALVYSSYLGSSGVDIGRCIAVDVAGSAYVTGQTASANFPTANPFQPAYGGGTNDAFVAKISASGPATQLQVTASAPAATAGAAFSLTVTARDAGGGIATGYTGTVTFTSSDPTATLPANYTFQASDNGVRTFPNVRLYVAAPQTITARDTVTASINGTTPNITVIPGSLTYFYIYAGTEPGPPLPPSVTLRTGEFYLFYLLPFDAYYNHITTYAGGLTTIYAPDPLATYAPSYTFTGSEGGLGFGYVAFGTVGVQELYCWNVGITVVGYARYNVIPPDGAPSDGRAPGSSDVSALLVLPPSGDRAGPAEAVASAPPAGPRLSALEYFFACGTKEQHEASVPPLSNQKRLPASDNWAVALRDELFQLSC